MNCHGMKANQTYECKSCGLKITVLAGCRCESCDACGPNEFACCDTTLTIAD